MARRRLIIHGSQEEMEMFEPIYETRLRLQHGNSTFRFQLPDPPPPQYQEEPQDDPNNAGVNLHNPDHPDNNGADAEIVTSCWRTSSDDEENCSFLLDDIPTGDQSSIDSGAVNTAGESGLQGNGRETTASARPVSDSDSDSDS